MVDFKKFQQKWRESLSEEEREWIDKIQTARKKNIFYQTETWLDNEQLNKEQKQTVLLYRNVYREGDSLVVQPKILLSFGGYREYHFDREFVQYISKKLKEDPNARFCIDMGERIYVKSNEIRRILQESIAEIQKRKTNKKD